jgi:hypothetical protein
LLVLVMIANNKGAEAKRLRETYPDRIGHIYSPGGFKEPWPHFAIDNGAFSAWSKGTPFDADAFRRLLDRVVKAPTSPRFVAVPDVVADRHRTIESWWRWLPELLPYGWPLAFVMQDGMCSADVPREAAVVFVGGTTLWKQQSAPIWCANFPRVHIGRVNGQKDLWRYHRLGAESCDGTGWFRGKRRQLDGLWYYLADSEGLDDAAHGPIQRRIFA